MLESNRGECDPDNGELLPALSECNQVSRHVMSKAKGGTVRYVQEPNHLFVMKGVASDAIQMWLNSGTELGANSAADDHIKQRAISSLPPELFLARCL